MIPIPQPAKKEAAEVKFARALEDVGRALYDLKRAHRKFRPVDVVRKDPLDDFWVGFFFLLAWVFLLPGAIMTPIGALNRDQSQPRCPPNYIYSGETHCPTCEGLCELLLPTVLSTHGVDDAACPLGYVNVANLMCLSEMARLVRSTPWPIQQNVPLMWAGIVCLLVGGVFLILSGLVLLKNWLNQKDKRDEDDEPLVVTP